MAEQRSNELDACQEWYSANPPSTYQNDWQFASACWAAAAEEAARAAGEERDAAVKWLDDAKRPGTLWGMYRHALELAGGSINSSKPLGSFVRKIIEERDALREFYAATVAREIEAENGSAITIKAAWKRLRVARDAVRRLDDAAMTGVAGGPGGAERSKA